MFRIVFVLCLFISVFYTQKAPTLFVRECEQEEAKYRPIQIKSLSIEVTILDTVAETTMRLTFHNSSDSELEGEFILPLPEGSTISGFALDIQGQMVDGVVVEKHKARAAFEREKRKKIDPGLVEWIQGNHFRSRIYPIPAQGERCIQVRYLSTFMPASNTTAYRLPLYFGHLEDFKLKISVPENKKIPIVQCGDLKLLFKKQDNANVAEVEQHQRYLGEDLTIEIPKSFPNVEVEKDHSKEVYFAIQDTPEPPKTPSSKVSPKRISLYWDASFSRKKTSKEKEFELLEALCKSWNTVVIDVFIFRNQLESPKTAQIQNGSAEHLINYLKEIPYDGGTQFSALTFPQKRISEKDSTVYDFVLLFSDGIQTLGKIEKQSLKLPLYIIASENQANSLFLRSLAESSEGNYFNLTVQPLQEVVEQVGRCPFAFLGAIYDTSQITEIYPSGRQNISSSFEFTGKLLAEEATLLLQYGYGSQVTSEKTIQLSQKEKSQTGLLSKFWAQKKIMELALYPEANHRELLKLGQRFGLVTPETSLIVLENLDQYLKYEIEPPDCLQEMKNEWLQAMDGREQEQKNNIENKINQLIGEWNGRVNWWNKDFSQWRVNDMEYLETEEHSSEGGIGAVTFSEPTPTLEIEVALKPWDPETPYTKILEVAYYDNRAYQSYLDMRDGYYAKNPAFYLDCANFFWIRRENTLALRILSTILELKLESPELLRLVAYRLSQEEKEIDLTIGLLEEVLQMRQEEPQSYRDLALMKAKRGEQQWKQNPESSKRDLESALQLLYQIIFSNWDHRFEGIDAVVLMELNRLLVVADRLEKNGQIPIVKPILDSRLCQLLDVDLRIVVTWDSDQTDIDLQIIEPTSEKCFYNNQETAIGGQLSRDFTGGYGPEEYCLHHLISGTYKIKVNYYGDNSGEFIGESNTPVAPVTVKVTIFTNYGRAEESFQEMTLRLDKLKDTIEIGTVTFFNLASDSKNLLSQRLKGHWKMEPVLTARLNGDQTIKEISFTSDFTAQKAIPEEYANQLSNKSIYFIGRMTFNQTEYPFLLIEEKGIPQIIYFEQTEKAQTFNVSIGNALDQKNDLLFLSKDSSPAVVFERIRE
ncbi:MAG: VIT domain-containing protein [Planctomycetota bacterium]